MDKRWSKLFISSAALGSLVLALVLDIDVNAGIVALVVLAALPWLASVVESVELPGLGSLRLREVQDKVQRQQEQLGAQERKLNDQQKIITQLVLYSMSWYLFDLLANLYHRARTGEEYLYRSGAMDRDLRFLRDHGYLVHFTITDLRDGENLVGKVQLTPVGNFLVELREGHQAQQAADVTEALA